MLTMTHNEPSMENKNEINPRQSGTCRAKNPASMNSEKH